jgi:hypothetical protein
MDLWRLQKLGFPSGLIRKYLVDCHIETEAVFSTLHSQGSHCTPPTHTVSMTTLLEIPGYYYGTPCYGRSVMPQVDLREARPREEEVLQNREEQHGTEQCGVVS